MIFKKQSRRLVSASFFVTLSVITGSLSGCASVKESYGPDGRKAYALNCSGLARGWINAKPQPAKYAARLVTM